MIPAPPCGHVRAAIARAAVVLLCAAALSAHAAAPKRILMLHSFGRDTAPNDTVTSSFRTEMLHAWAGQAAFYDFTLEAGPLGPPESEGAIVEVMRSRFANMEPDLVVAVGAPASQFYGKHREELFPSVPLLMLGMDQRIVPVEHIKQGDFAVDGEIVPCAGARGDTRAATC